MADNLTRQQRRWTMSRVRSKDTRPELQVRSLLHRLGYRFTLRRRDLPGRPDVVLPKYKAVVFVHGCFWHRHPRCKRATMPMVRNAYWSRKFQRNLRRDRDVREQLRRLGWKVIVIWECQIDRDTDAVGMRLVRALRQKR